MGTRGGSRFRGVAGGLVLALVATVVAVEGLGRFLYEKWLRPARASLLAGVSDSSLRRKLEHDFVDPSTRIRYAYDMFLGWRAEPNQRGLTYEINGSGRRDSLDYDNAGGAGVFLTGGSAAWSFGASDNAHTIAARMGAHLSALQGPGSKVRVLNLAEQAYGLRQERITVIDELSRVRPRVVVFYDGVNDAHTVMMGRDPQHFRTYTEFPVMLREALEEYEGRWLISPRAVLQASVGYRVIELARRAYRRRAVSDQPRQLSGSERETIGKFFGRQLVELNQLVRGLGARPLFVLQPIGYVGKTPTEEERRFLSEKNDPLAGWWRAAYEVLETVYADAGHDGIDTLSLAAVFTNESRQIYIDPTHMSDLGNEMVAHVLAKRVAAALQTEAEPTQDRTRSLCPVGGSR